MEDKMEGIRKRLIQLRKQCGYSYQDLAEKTGLSKSSLQRYETGQIQNIPLSQLEPLARALHTTPAYLMGWEQDAIIVDTTQTPEDLELEEIWEKIEKGTATPEERKKYKAFVEKATASLKNTVKEIGVMLSALNDMGQQKALERVEELTEIPKYKRETAENAEEAPNTPSEGKNRPG